MDSIVRSLSASIPDADDGDTSPFGHFDDFGNLVGVHLSHRTPENGEILTEAENSSTIDAPVTCDDTIAELRVHVHIVIPISMSDQCINLDE